MLQGFSIAGFRSFTGDPQRVGPLSRVNIFIGVNNSGKSNILRYILRVLSPAIRPGRREPVAVKGVDVPRAGQSPTSLNWEIPFNPLQLFGDNVRWEEAWTEALVRSGVVTAEGSLRVPITLGEVQQGKIYAGAIPNFQKGDERYIHHAWSTVLGMNGGSLNNWFPDLINRAIQKSLVDLHPHFVPSFRQITTKRDEFTDEFSAHQGEDHLIDELAALAHPSYDEQEKKLQFEKLRKFIGGIINDPQVAIEIPADRSTINVKSGRDFLPIEALGSGIHEVFMLASELILRDNSTILLEEPEVHLHPHLQRRLMSFIVEETSAQYFITTHSASIIDTAAASVFGVSLEGGATIRPLLNSQERFLACKELGFRASDLLQANCVVWVEGPSDRVYLLEWINRVGPGLVEGIDFTIMFYGGKLLSRLSAADELQLDEFVSILPLCRQAALVADSDKGSGTAQVRQSKLRVQIELEQIGGYFWLTEGREIENYYSTEARLRAVQSAHPKAVRLTGGPTKYSKPLNYEDADGNVHEKGFDKMKVAKHLSVSEAPSEEAFARVRELVEFIRSANV